MQTPPLPLSLLNGSPHGSVLLSLASLPPRASSIFYKQKGRSEWTRFLFSFPSFLYKKIFSYLNYAELLNVSLVCDKWKDVALAIENAHNEKNNVILGSHLRSRSNDLSSGKGNNQNGMPLPHPPRLKVSFSCFQNHQN